MQTVGYDGSHRPEPPGGDVGVGQGGLLVAVGVGWGGRGVGVAVGGGGGVVGVEAAWPAGRAGVAVGVGVGEGRGGVTPVAVGVVVGVGVAAGVAERLSAGAAPTFASRCPDAVPAAPGSVSPAPPQAAATSARAPAAITRHSLTSSILSAMSSPHGRKQRERGAQQGAPLCESAWWSRRYCWTGVSFEFPHSAHEPS